MPTLRNSVSYSPRFKVCIIEYDSCVVTSDGISLSTLHPLARHASLSPIYPTLADTLLSLLTLFVSRDFSINPWFWALLADYPHLSHIKYCLRNATEMICRSSHRWARAAMPSAASH